MTRGDRADRLPDWPSAVRSPTDDAEVTNMITSITLVSGVKS